MRTRQKTYAGGAARCRLPDRGLGTDRTVRYSFTLAIAFGAAAWTPLLAWNVENAEAGLRFQLVAGAAAKRAATRRKDQPAHPRNICALQALENSVVLAVYRQDGDSATLRRLQTDHIDIYQLHRPDPHTALEDTLEALSTMITPMVSNSAVAPSSR
mgnify:CR=1 FL=1